MGLFRRRRIGSARISGLIQRRMRIVFMEGWLNNGWAMEGRKKKKILLMSRAICQTGAVQKEDLDITNEFV